MVILRRELELRSLSCSAESRPWLCTLTLLGTGTSFPGGWGAAPRVLMQNQKHLYDDNEQTVRLQGLPLKKENMFIWKKSQWAWGFAFSTFPRRFYRLKSAARGLPHFLVTNCWLSQLNGIIEMV